MSLNTAQDFALRLYSRIPSQYRVLDEEQGKPLLALMEVIGEQAANLRQDLDDLWDDFFIETCDDWVVPYIGALLGVNLLAQPVGQSNRLDVRDTVLWRRSKGTPAMLRELAAAITEWPTDLAEFFQTLGWSQNMNHVRLDAPLTPDLRDAFRLTLLGTASDPFAHAADFKPVRPLDQARVTPRSLGIGRAGWQTPGRHQIKNVGFFVRRLQTFRVAGATPASALPGAPPAVRSCFTFDPLFREIPLFEKESRKPITRAAFDRAPWNTFGSDIGVRQFGVLLASGTEPRPAISTSQTPFTFGNEPAAVLDPNGGLRLMDVRSFRSGAEHFVITAEWKRASSFPTRLGSLSTRHAVLNDAKPFHFGRLVLDAGKLIISLRTGRAGREFPGLPASPAAGFPGAVVAVYGSGPFRFTDVLYVYLPAVFVSPGEKITWYVADDGSTWNTPDFNAASLARASEGQIYPPREPDPPSVAPAEEFIRLDRGPAGLRIADPKRFGEAQVLFRAELWTGAAPSSSPDQAFEPIAATATFAMQDTLLLPDFSFTGTLPALSSVPSKSARKGDLPQRPTPVPPPVLTIFVQHFFLGQPQRGLIQATELIVRNRQGQSLLVYLPELSTLATGTGIRLLVADDGSTYFAPPVLNAPPSSLAGLTLARQALGQVLPVPGVWPIEQRRPVGLDLCRCERATLLRRGEMAIDPELGRFALAAGDAAIAQGAFSVDYVEAFSDRVGALNFDRGLDPAIAATRFVSQSGDFDGALTDDASAASRPVHDSLAAALTAAREGDVIEVVDSATYAASSEALLTVPLPPGGNPRAPAGLTIRAAAGQRPCFTFYSGENIPASASMLIHSTPFAPAPLARLEISGLLISGGPLSIEAPIQTLFLTACSLDPRTATEASLIGSALPLPAPARYTLCRCVTGALRVNPETAQITVADSIVDQRGGIAIAAVPTFGSPPDPDGPAGSVQLERVTVLGRIWCDVLVASECVFDDIAIVEDRQTGCIRFTRYERGSLLPRRFQCIPTEAQLAAASPQLRALPPRFNSRRFGRPDYLQLAASCPPEIPSASEVHAEIGAFASALNPIRLNNLQIKLREYMPAGLVAVIIGET